MISLEHSVKALSENEVHLFYFLNIHAWGFRALLLFIMVIYLHSTFHFSLLRVIVWNLACTGVKLVNINCYSVLEYKHRLMS